MKKIKLSIVVVWMKPDPRRLVCLNTRSQAVWRADGAFRTQSPAGGSTSGHGLWRVGLTRLAGHTFCFLCADVNSQLPAPATEPACCHSYSGTAIQHKLVYRLFLVVVFHHSNSKASVPTDLASHFPTLGLSSSKSLSVPCCIEDALFYGFSVFL